MIDIPARVKDALREGSYKKNYKFNILNDDGTVDFYIDNDTLVSESVKFDERMCTGDQLKFGLCEGSSLEFQYFDHPNITGRQIQALVEVQYVDGNGDLDWHTIPMGFFTVDQCPMQFSTGIRKVTAYNKLKSSYLDQKCNVELYESLDDPTIQVPVIGIRNYFLSDYEIRPTAQILTPDSITYNTVSVSLQVTNQNYAHDMDTPLTPRVQNRSGGLIVGENCYINFRAFTYSYTVTSTFYYQFIEIKRKIIDCQQAFIDYVKAIIDKSDPCNITGAQYIAALDGTTNAWRNLYSVSVNSGGTVKYYSDYAYKNGISGIAGSIEDLTKLIIENATTITITIPGYIILDGTSFGGGAYYGELFGPVMGYRVFNYIVPYPSLKYPDGEIIPNISTTEYPYTDWFTINKIENLSSADLILLDPETVPEFTLRDLTSASYETVAQYGKLDRETDLFAGVELNYSRLLPADTLYPNDALYPGGNSLRSDASMYQKLWTDSQGVQTFRYLIITYKTTENGQEVEKTLQRTVNADGTTDYYMSDNWLFKNLIWTAADVGDYADAMVLKMQNVSWFPFEMWCAGLPYIETGDELEITNSEGTYTSYVLQRQLNGIQNLQDTYINGELDIF